MTNPIVTQRREEGTPFRPVINAPSLLNCDFMHLADDVAVLMAEGIRFFHIDVIDGHYVPNLGFNVPFIRDLKKAYPDCTADVHLMVTNPADYLPALADAGADYVSFHADSTRFVRRTVQQIHDHGMKAGVAVNPSQPIAVLEPVLPYIDMAVLMTVEPGFVGQRFMDGSLERLEELHTRRIAAGGRALIEVDGGVDYPAAEACVKRRADILVTGVGVTFAQPDGLRAAARRFAAAMARLTGQEPG